MAAAVAAAPVVGFYDCAAYVSEAFQRRSDGPQRRCLRPRFRGRRLCSTSAACRSWRRGMHRLTWRAPIVMSRWPAVDRRVRVGRLRPGRRADAGPATVLPLNPVRQRARAVSLRGMGSPMAMLHSASVYPRQLTLAIEGSQRPPRFVVEEHGGIAPRCTRPRPWKLREVIGHAGVTYSLCALPPRADPARFT